MAISTSADRHSRTDCHEASRITRICYFPLPNFVRYIRSPSPTVQQCGSSRSLRDPAIPTTANPPQWLQSCSPSVIIALHIVAGAGHPPTLMSPALPDRISDRGTFSPSTPHLMHDELFTSHQRRPTNNMSHRRNSRRACVCLVKATTGRTGCRPCSKRDVAPHLCLCWHRQACSLTGPNSRYRYPRICNRRLDEYCAEYSSWTTTPNAYRHP